MVQTMRVVAKVYNLKAMACEVINFDLPITTEKGLRIFYKDVKTELVERLRFMGYAVEKASYAYYGSIFDIDAILY